MFVDVEWLLCYCTLLLWSWQSTLALTPRKKFQYKHSFKGPHLVQRDGSIPFWDKGGSAIASDEFVRVTPSLRSKKGYVWNRERQLDNFWEVEITVKIAGRGRVGADGLAIWYTGDRNMEGPVFGGPDKWRGLAIILDSFDNDNQHNNPYIMGMLNDGTSTYNHQFDGSNQQLGGCLRDYRNKPYASKLKIEYYQDTLSVLFKNGIVAPADQDYELCFRAEQVDLPEKGYFGITAATGGLADDHDVLSFMSHSLKPPRDSEVQDAPKVSDEDQQKYSQEFEEYRKKLEEAKMQYQQAHPEAVVDMQDESATFEGREIQELRMIFEGQSAMHHTLRDIHRKLDEMFGRQERTSMQVTQLQNQLQEGAGGGQRQPPPAGGQAQLPSADSIKRHEVDQIINTNRELQRNVQDIRSFVNDIQSKVHNLNQQGGGGGGVKGSASTDELKTMLESSSNNIKILLNRPPCPPASGNCITLFHLLGVVVLQIFAMFGYMFYRNSKDAAAKKFY